MQVNLQTTGRSRLCGAVSRPSAGTWRPRAADAVGEAQQRLTAYHVRSFEKSKSDLGKWFGKPSLPLHQAWALDGARHVAVPIGLSPPRVSKATLPNSDEPVHWYQLDKRAVHVVVAFETANAVNPARDNAGTGLWLAPPSARHYLRLYGSIIMLP